MSARNIFARPARYAAIAPYLWMVLFFLVPFGFVLKIALSQTAIAQPPYTPVFDLWEGREATKAALEQLSIDNFKLLVSDNLYALSYLRSGGSSIGSRFLRNRPSLTPRAYSLLMWSIAVTFSCRIALERSRYSPW